MHKDDPATLTAPALGATPVQHPKMGAHWMPFTANRQFKQAPRLMSKADGMHYWTPEGRQILDGIAGLWCVNAGHNRPKIVSAIQAQAAEMDFAPPFNMGHPKAFELAERLVELTPEGMNKVFFTNSGSEAVETALKMAIAYHRVRGEGSRTRLIGRERGYHGVNFGGISVGGIVGNRKMFGTMLGGVDHMRHTHDLARNAYSRGVPEHGAELADDLERMVALHDASTIAAVIVEPVAGSTGVLLPPKGYLERLRAICDKHGILLIFDEVITGFGRLGTPFGANYFQVQPDLTTFAKAVNNATVPLGGVIVRDDIHQAFMTGPAHAIEFFHGYTYSAHPLAVAAAHATLDVLAEDKLIERAAQLAPVLEKAVHSLRGEPHVTDIRNLGLAAAIELAPISGQPGLRAVRVFERALDEGLLVRFSGECIALAPPFISEPDEITAMIEGLRRALRAVPA